MLERSIASLRAGAFDVVQFADRGVRSDAGLDQVFLALPGQEIGGVVAFDAGRVCAPVRGGRRRGSSSCRPARAHPCLALSRMASFGVPAVAGFRWPVVDGDAAKFHACASRGAARMRRLGAHGLGVPRGVAPSEGYRPR